MWVAVTARPERERETEKERGRERERERSGEGDYICHSHLGLIRCRLGWARWSVVTLVCGSL
jgi:hypothetical protein